MKLLVATVLVLLTVAMAASHDVTTRPVLADNQLYFYMAERCASGVPPHVAHWEVKTQLPTLLSGAAMAVGRRFGVDDVPAGRTATVAAAAIAVVLAWLLALELTASAAASVAGAAAVFAIYGLFLEAASGFQPKLYMVAFMLAAHLQCAQRRWLGTGITAMAAFLCWQPAGLVLASCAVAALLDRHGGRSAFARLSAGALSALAAYEAWFLWQGALAAQVHQELFLAFGSTYTPIDWRKSVWFLLTEARAFEHAPHLVPTAFAGATATLWAGLLVRPRRAFAMLREKPGLVAFWTAAHLVTLFTLIDHQAHPDMLLVQPYFAVACGIAFGWIESLVRRAPGGAVLVWMAAAMVVAGGWSIASRDAARSRVGANTLAAQYAMADLLDLYHDHRGSVWVVGSVHLLGFQHRDNWVAVGNFGRETREIDRSTYRPLKDGRMPEVILAGRGLRPGARAWLPAEYVDITPAVFAAARIRVFSRNPGPGFGFDRESAPRPYPAPGAAKSPKRPTEGSMPGDARGGFHGTAAEPVHERTTAAACDLPNVRERRARSNRPGAARGSEPSHAATSFVPDTGRRRPS